MEVTRKTLAKILVVVFVGNLVVMGAGALYSYQNAPPIPQQVAGPDGTTVATNEQIQTGKAVFQSNGLMNHGSILGNGAYFGEDFTADTLDLKTQYMQQFYANKRHSSSYRSLPDGRQAAIDSRVTNELDKDYDGGPVQYSAAELFAHRQIREEYVKRYAEGDRERGVPAGMIGSPEDARRFADFALWTAWVSHTDRPGADYSYTNNWPYNPVAGNVPAGPTVVWSAFAMILLIAGAGIGVWLYHSIELAEPEIAGIEIPDPREVDLLPSQRAATRYIPVAALLFTVQVLFGALLAHYYVERDGFFGLGELLGIDILQWLPFAISKTYHLDLAILWVATLWIGAGLFLPGLLTGYEPDHQRTLVNVLLGALIVVIVGGFVGVWLGFKGIIGIDNPLWWILGNEGLEYVEVGRLWQFGLVIGFALWTLLIYRGFKPMLDREPRYGLAHMIIYAGGSIGLMFIAGVLYTPKTNMVMTEFWRWWVVHMWVEGTFEFFIVAVIGITLVSMGLLKKRSAEKAVILQALFVMGSGVIGASHHYWWVGLPDVWIPFGSIFSTLELIPLILILFEALGQYRALAGSDETFAYRLPFMFIIASGAWNFLGAGVLGFFINLPMINYYEHGTYLTVAHAHAAMFGAFGFLALGMATYMLRLTVNPDQWDERRLRWAFWLWNAGLAVMVLISLMPIGFLQLETAFTQGYDAARSLAFYNDGLVQLLFWARLPGDTMIILGTVIFAYDVIRKRFVLRETATPEDSPGGTIPDRVFSEGDD